VAVERLVKDGIAEGVLSGGLPSGAAKETVGGHSVATWEQVREGGRDVTTWRMTFPATSKGARAARLFTCDIVGGEGAGTDEVALIVSELAANAVLHAGTPFTVTIHRNGESDHFRIEVSDGSSVLPQVKDHGQSAPTGRGLRIVDRLTHDWGVEATDDGKVVWVEVQPSRLTMA
jgi:anti-sigma regulatory factor (Ser/Thr protein kinase)